MRWSNDHELRNAQIDVQVKRVIDCFMSYGPMTRGVLNSRVQTISRSMQSKILYGLREYGIIKIYPKYPVSKMGRPSGLIYELVRSKLGRYGRPPWAR